MSGNKARALDQWSADNGLAFTRFDYLGHGESSGRFVDGTIGRWIDDALAVIDECTSGPLILVGSSMGGWLMLHCALARPDRIAGLVGIASAPDFTERGIRGSLNATQQVALAEAGFFDRPSEYDDEPYRITRELLDEGRSHLVMDKPLLIRCPVRLIHGQSDQDVPWQWSVELADNIQSDNVEITLIKGGDHRLSKSAELQTIRGVLDRLVTL